MKESIHIKVILNALPKEIYEAWLDGEKHEEMTGGEASAENSVGASFTAWDGYITGKNLELKPHTEIVQSWRTSEFKDTDEDSKLTIQLKEVENGTELTLIHTNIPEGQTQYEEGWKEHYFEPMAAYFAG